MKARRLTPGEEKQNKRGWPSRAERGNICTQLQAASFHLMRGWVPAQQSQSTFLCSEASLGGFSCPRTPGVWVHLVGDDSHYAWSWSCVNDGQPCSSRVTELLPSMLLLSLSSGTFPYLLLLQTWWCWLLVPRLVFGLHKRHWAFLCLHHASANSTLTISFILNKTIPKKQTKKTKIHLFDFICLSILAACMYVYHACG